MSTPQIGKDFARFARIFPPEAAKQLQFATALALTRTAQAAQRHITAGLPRIFRDPVERTRHAVRIVMTDRHTPISQMKAVVYIADRSARGATPQQYLAAEILGGPRRDKASERVLRSAGILPEGEQTVVASGAPKNARGVLNGAAMRAILNAASGKATPDAKKRAAKLKLAHVQTGTAYFVATRKGGGKQGIFRVVSKGAVAPVLWFVRDARYAMRLPFDALAEAESARAFFGEMGKAVRVALATARQG
jgi:hypothetical protein